MNKLDEARKIIDSADEMIAKGFEMRMEAVKQVAEYKKENNMPILDISREKEVIEKNSKRLCDQNMKPYYVNVLKEMMSESRKFQLNQIGQSPNKLTVSLGENSYDIFIEKGVLSRANQVLNLDRKVLVVTDDGVPGEYAESVKNQCREGYIYTVPQGEGSKSIECFEKLLQFMLSKGFTRKDCVVAVGGGVVGDLAGFTASCYMRGVDFYNIPTTVLSQVDSSIGGKTAVNLDSIKNIVGAFNQPKAVLIDVNVLKSLPQRQISNGLAEAVKAAVIADYELFELFENGNIDENLELIIYKSLDFKRKVVEEDEKETGLRKILNFGHTIGHGIESEELINGLYHGECVAIGMVAMSSPEVRNRLVPVLQKLNLPISIAFDSEKVLTAIGHDKKSVGKSISAVVCNKIGTCEIVNMTIEEIKAKFEIINHD